MKTKVLIIAAAGLLLAAAALVIDPSPPSAPAKVAVRKHSNSVNRTPLPATEPNTPPAPQDDNDEAGNLTAWQLRFDALVEKHGDREDAIAALLAQVSSTYGDLVQHEIARLADQPPAERYDELAEIESSVSEGMTAIFEKLGIDTSRRVAATAATSDAIAAETQYAEAAPDPASRLALLWLDREREARAEQALALADPSEQSQAMAALEAWYEDGLGGIFTPGGIE